MIKKCVVCTGEFESENVLKTICSPICRLKLKSQNEKRRVKMLRESNPPKTKTCLVCSSIFPVHRANKTCSAACRYQNLIDQRVKYSAIARRPPVLKYCLVCSVEFKPPSKTWLTCSRECSAKHRRAHDADRKVRKIKTCEICDGEYRPIGSSKTCSEKCRRTRSSLYFRSYRSANRDKLNRRARQWQSTNPDKRRDYYNRWKSKPGVREYLQERERKRAADPVKRQQRNERENARYAASHELRIKRKEREKIRRLKFTNIQREKQRIASRLRDRRERVALEALRAIDPTLARAYILPEDRRVKMRAAERERMKKDPNYRSKRLASQREHNRVRKLKNPLWKKKYTIERRAALQVITDIETKGIGALL